MRLISLFLILFYFVSDSNSQSFFDEIIPQDDNYNDDLNTITTAVPFLSITPDSRAGAMGESGVATSPDLYSIFWNASKLAFMEDNSGFSISYTPWLSQLVPDISLAYLTGYSKINETSAWSASMRYFSLGNIQFTDETGENLGSYDPNEFAVNIGYGMKLNDNISGGLVMRYLYSNLTGNQYVAGELTEPGNGFAVDLSSYYQSTAREMDEWALGLNISNIGTKISYSASSDKDFLPMNLRFGGRYTYIIDEFNKVSASFDVNKLLVPTPPRWATDSTNSPIIVDGEQLIEAGMNPDVSVVSAIFQSFGDAPGGITEEWRELMYSLGFEYWYNNQFAFRGGYFHEHNLKGGRKYFTMGAGLKMNVFELDFAYLVTASQNVRSPLENTMRFTLIFDIGAFRGGANNEL